MEKENMFQIRATGILIKEEKILLVKQKVSSDREWSLPGGRVERGETLERAVTRELREETGLETEVVQLLYVCDKSEANLIHMTFLLRKIGGDLTLPSNEFDKNPIADVRMVPIDELPAYQFSEKFTGIVRNHFPEAGSYQGEKIAIGL